MIPTLGLLIENDLKPNNGGFDMSCIWVSIITKLFPTEEGFFNGPVSQFGGARADLFTLHSVLSFKTHEKNFFVVEYRPPGDEPTRMPGQLQSKNYDNI